MTPDVVNWLRKEASALQPVPVSAAFVHIPVPEFLTAWNSGTAVGRKAEAVCCPSCNSGIYRALVCGSSTSSSFINCSLHEPLMDVVQVWAAFVTWSRRQGIPHCSCICNSCAKAATIESDRTGAVDYVFKPL